MANSHPGHLVRGTGIFKGGDPVKQVLISHILLVMFMLNLVSCSDRLTLAMVRGPDPAWH